MGSAGRVLPVTEHVDLELGLTAALLDQQAGQAESQEGQQKEEVEEVPERTIVGFWQGLYHWHGYLHLKANIFRSEHYLTGKFWAGNLVPH